MHGIHNFTMQQLASAAAIDEDDSQMYPSWFGRIAYEIDPGAPMLSRESIAKVLRDAARLLKGNSIPDVTIMVHGNGNVAYKLEFPGLSAT